jgi:hypothetical protein
VKLEDKLYCDGCGHEFPKNTDGEGYYIALALVVEEKQTRQFSPGSYMICGDCMLRNFMPRGRRARPRD